MSKPSRRPRREEWKQARKDRKREWKELRRQQATEGLKPLERKALPNQKSNYRTGEEEQEARQTVVEQQLRVFRTLLPGLLKKLARIPDPRCPQTRKHKLTVLLLYGLLLFVLRMNSRREANREMSLPVFWENLQRMFPELESLPHGDTLKRLLERINPEKLQEAVIDQVRLLIRNKKFLRYLVGRQYLVAIDGTRKFTREYQWADECSSRQISGTNEVEYYVYVLEADLVFPNGLTLPLRSEFLEYNGRPETKEDCELRAFQRLAQQLKKDFPRLPLMVLLDGLYPNGPVMALCRRFGWQFMIVLQNDSLLSVWEEAEGLGKLQPGQELDHVWGDRRQHFRWVNQIEYAYGPYERYKQWVHLVVCEESWEEIDPKTGKVVEKQSRHAWLSSEPLTRQNVVMRCNQYARRRWRIENHLLVEKHQGYQYEHCFSYNWNAMKGYHYLMRLGDFLNTLALHSVELVEWVRSISAQGVLNFIRTTISGPWLDEGRIKRLVATPHQLRLA